ncbi:hypothetical protein PQQ64_31720 [Paraburkholderia graminis]|uniref:hypothetical protein n=1 Tax=Paraburkholderia graminis TaxID=60548 RepID=UPI0038B9C82B
MSIPNRQQRIIESARQRPAMMTFIGLLHRRVKMPNPSTSVGSRRQLRGVKNLSQARNRLNAIRLCSRFTQASWQKSETMVRELSALLLIVLMASTGASRRSFPEWPA